MSTYSSETSTDFPYHSRIALMHVDDVENPTSWTTIVIFGEKPSIEVSTSSPEFVLMLTERLDGNTFKISFNVKLNFKNSAEIEIMASDLSGTEVSPESVQFEPKIEYTGTLTNANEYGDNLKKVADASDTAAATTSKSGLSPGAIAGIVIAAVVVVGAAVGVTIFIIMKKKANAVAPA